MWSKLGERRYAVDQASDGKILSYWKQNEVTSLMV
jgi:hypothetical protein